MGMSEFYGATRRRASRSRTIHRALELGVTLPRHRRHVRPVHERAARRPRRSRAARDQVVLATKFGNVRGENGERLGHPRRRRLRARGVRRVAAAARRRAHRPLLPAPRRPERADRGDGRRDGRAGRGRQGPLPRPVGGLARDDPPRARRAPDQRAADRVLAVDARRRGARSCRPCASWGSASSPTARSGAASCPAAVLAGGPPRGRLPPQQPALPGRELHAQHGDSSSACESSPTRRARRRRSSRWRGCWRAATTSCRSRDEARAYLEENVAANDDRRSPPTTSSSSTTRHRPARRPASATRTCRRSTPEPGTDQLGTVAGDVQKPLRSEL